MLQPTEDVIEVVNLENENDLKAIVTGRLMPSVVEKQGEVVL